MLNQKLKSKRRLITFSDFVDLFKLSVRNSHQKSTRNADNSKLNQLNGYFGEYDIAEINHVDIIEWIAYVEDEKQYVNKTINEYFRLLRAVFNIAVNNGNMPKSPMAGIRNKVISEYDSARPFTLQELRTIENTQAQFEDGKLLALTMAYSGCRPSEAIALRVSDVDLKSNILRVRNAMVLEEFKCTKTKGSERKIQINEKLGVVLRKQLSNAEANKLVTIERKGRDGKSRKKENGVFLFTDQNGNHFKDVKTYTQKFWTRFMKQADKLHLTTYCESIEARGISQMRHTFASHALTAGVNKDWLAKTMGHADTEMVDKIYAEWIVEDGTDQTKILDLHFNKKTNSATNASSFEKVA